MSEIIIRKWRMNDFQIVRNILLKTWLDTYSFIPEDDIKFYLDKYYSEEKLKVIYTDKDTQCFISELNVKPVGWMKTFNNISQGRFYVSSLYVLPEFQGFRIGSMLMKKAEEIAKSKNFDRIWLGVMSKNIKALKWYEKKGFTFPEEEPFQMGKTKVMHLIGYKFI